MPNYSLSLNVVPNLSMGNDTGLRRESAPDCGHQALTLAFLASLLGSGSLDCSNF